MLDNSILLNLFPLVKVVCSWILSTKITDLLKNFEITVYASALRWHFGNKKL